MVKVRISYNTTPDSGAIQWLEPSQTSGKKHPFVYTQCEAILARSLLPCQDTPAVKAPYDIKVRSLVLEMYFLMHDSLR